MYSNKIWNKLHHNIQIKYTEYFEQTTEHKITHIYKLL